MSNWPKQSGRDAFYGSPRSKDPTKSSLLWEIANIKVVKPPFQMYYAGKPIKGIRIHKLCADSLLRVLDAIWIASGKSQTAIDRWGVSVYGGAYNYRLARGSNFLSSHSWGCAIDLDPARNGFGDSNPEFAKIPAVVKAFADEGWTWGGTWTKPDAMHFQAASVG